MADIEKMWDQVNRLYTALGKKDQLCLTGVSPEVEICYIRGDECIPVFGRKTVESVLQDYIEELKNELRQNIACLKYETAQKISHLESLI